MKYKRMEFVKARERKTCKKQEELQVVMVSSKDVHSSLVQDRFKPMVIVGSDVIFLYPNLTLEAGYN